MEVFKEGFLEKEREEFVQRVAWGSRTREAAAPKVRSNLTEAAQTLSNQAGRGGAARTLHDVEMHRKAGHPVPPLAQPINHLKDSTCFFF